MTGILRGVVALVMLLTAAWAHANATVETVAGELRAGATVATAVPVRLGDRIGTGSYVVTGPKSRATLRFPDGQAVVLHESTEFRITEYAYTRDTPAGDRSILELVTGVMRYVSGALARRSPNAVVVRTRLATAGVRGTDFMLALVNPLYFRILNGQVSVVNSAGAPLFGPGAIGTVAADGAVALSVPASALPAGIVQAFQQLALVNLTVLTPAIPATATGLLPAAGAFVIPGAIIIGIAAALAGDDAASATTTVTGTGTQ